RIPSGTRRCPDAAPTVAAGSHRLRPCDGQLHRNSYGTAFPECRRYDVLSASRAAEFHNLTSGHDAHRVDRAPFPYCTCYQERELRSSKTDLSPRDETTYILVQYIEPCVCLLNSNAAFLRWTASVMRDGSHVSDIGNFVTTGVQCAHGGFTSGSRPLDHYVEVLQAVFSSR